MIPPQIVAKFCNAIGAIIRTKVVVDPTIEKWTLVPEGKKETMWQLLSRTFVFPRGTRDKVKHYARKMLGETFCRWKSELNVRYVKKGLTPFADFGDITPAQWEEFVRQKTTEQTLALSQKQSDLAKSNIHKVHLGPGGYIGKLDQWCCEREAAIAAGQPDPYDGLDERGWQWNKARKPKLVDGKPKFDQPETDTVAQKMLELAELQK